MKKTACLFLFLLVLLSVPACADTPGWIPPGANIQWPPPAPSYKIPTVGYDVDALGIVADSIKVTMRAVGTKGFWILMLFAVIGSIPDIFRIFFIDPFEIRAGVRRRMVNRRIKAADIRRNHDEIIAEKVRDMELNNEAQQMFRMLHSEELLTQRIRQMEFNAHATELYKRANADLISKRRIADMERGFFDRRKFKRENRVELMMEKRYDMKEADSARALHKLEDRNEIFRRRLADMETNDALRDVYREGNHDKLINSKVHSMEMSQEARNEYNQRHYSEEEDVAKRVRNMEMNHRARNAYDDLHYSEDEEVAKRARHMEENLKAKELFHQRNFDAEVEEDVTQRVKRYESEREYNERYPNLYGKRRDQYKQLAKDYYEGNL